MLGALLYFVIFGYGEMLLRGFVFFCLYRYVSAFSTASRAHFPSQAAARAVFYKIGVAVAVCPTMFELYFCTGPQQACAMWLLATSPEKDAIATFAITLAAFVVGFERAARQLDRP